MSHVVRDQIAVISCCFVVLISDFVYGMGESLINMILQWISFDQIVADPQIDGKLRDGVCFLFGTKMLSCQD